MSKVMFVLVAMVALGMVACGGEDRTPGGETGATGSADCPDLTEGDTFTITISDFAYDPSCLTARAAQSISIVNEDSADHTFTIDGSQIDVQIAGGETFNGEPVSGVLQPGTYDFLCRFHPSMTGTITVE